MGIRDSLPMTRRDPTFLLGLITLRVLDPILNYIVAQWQMTLWRNLKGRGGGGGGGGLLDCFNIFWTEFHIEKAQIFQKKVTWKNTQMSMTVNMTSLVKLEKELLRALDSWIHRPTTFPLPSLCATCYAYSSGQLQQSHIKVYY